MEGKCARDVTRKEEAVVKEASEPSSQSGTSRYKLGKVVSSAIGRFSRGINWGIFCQFFWLFFSFTTPQEGKKEERRYRGEEGGQGGKLCEVSLVPVEHDPGQVAKYLARRRKSTLCRDS